MRAWPLLGVTALCLATAPAHAGLAGVACDIDGDGRPERVRLEGSRDVALIDACWGHEGMGWLVCTLWHVLKDGQSVFMLPAASNRLTVLAADGHERTAMDVDFPLDSTVECRQAVRDPAREIWLTHRGCWGIDQICSSSMMVLKWRQSALVPVALILDGDEKARYQARHRGAVDEIVSVEPEPYGRHAWRWDPARFRFHCIGEDCVDDLEVREEEASRPSTP